MRLNFDQTNHEEEVILKDELCSDEDSEHSTVIIKQILE